MQKHSFYPPKGHLLPTKSIGFVDQKLTFREVKYYVLQWPYYQKVTILHFFRRHKTAFCVGVNTFQQNSALRVFSYSVFSFLGAAFHLLLQNYSLQFSQHHLQVTQISDISFLSTTYIMIRSIHCFQLLAYQLIYFMEFKRFDKLQFTFLRRPNDRSMCWVICRSWRGVSSVSTHFH